MSAVGLVILAAGAATRMGTIKQLLPVGGRSLLRHTAEEAISSGCRPVVVVLGAYAERLQAELQDLPVRAVVNPRWQEGMGTSVGAGIQAMLADPAGEQITAVVVAVCDQPFFSCEIIRQLIAAWQKSGCALVASEYGGSRGVPALFDRSLFPELLALKGQEGARRVIHAHSESAVTTPFAAGAFDIDTPEDYARLGAMNAAASESITGNPDLPLTENGGLTLRRWHLGAHAAPVHLMSDESRKRLLLMIEMDRLPDRCRSATPKR